MSCLLLTLLLASPPAAAASSAAEESRPRPYHELHADLRTWLRREADAESGAERAEAVERLAALHRELLSDPRLSASPTLQGYRAKLWGRLIKIKQELERRLAREATSSGSSVDGRSLAGASAPSPGGAAVADYGPALVALIERTISPEFWDVQGGPGTIVYYAPLKALVVRATTEVHHQLGRALRALREAGR